jgi:hypothetical protein
MKFKPAPDNDKDMIYQRIVSEDGKIEIGIHPVMFGFRVRAGYVGNPWVHLDWCGGADHSAVEILYSMAKNILEAKGDFRDLPPCSKVKPFYKDPSFIAEVMRHVVAPMEMVKLESLEQFRQKMLNNSINSFYE